MSDRRTPITILLADDDEEDRMLASEALEAARLGNDLRFVSDGEELLAYLRHEGKYADPESSPRPGVILLDLNMPRMDGREALEHIKSDPTLRKIPVVIMTTSRAEEDIDSSYDHGASGFVVKPVEFDGLVAAFQSSGKYWFQVVERPDSEA